MVPEIAMGSTNIAKDDDTAFYHTCVKAFKELKISVIKYVEFTKYIEDELT